MFYINEGYYYWIPSACKGTIFKNTIVSIYNNVVFKVTKNVHVEFNENPVLILVLSKVLTLKYIYKFYLLIC